ncbi:hypothetical protein [Mycobacterium hubeiense]|uniref:Rv0361 family membrane protein n=1 Tax=Mycobacterium hubeiense TaxID=1867256 RepID=UPI000C7EAE6E|nr:hypothetical protein [Mycobacterium sp. QGD 101]
MAGPNPPDYGAGAVGPQPYPGPPQPYPQNPVAPSAYPGMLPPPVPYPKRRRWRWVVGALLVLAVVAGLVAAVVFAARDDNSAARSGVLTEETARTAIQNYLDALAGGDDETVARHTLCGLYDAVKERRSDLSLANLASDAFRKQFSSAEVTSIDKIVPWSANQAQVLFTMRVVPAGSARGEDRDEPRDREEQAVVQVLVQDKEILICSYLLRTGQY